MNNELSCQPLKSHRLVEDVVNRLQHKIAPGEIQQEEYPTELKLMTLWSGTLYDLRSDKEHGSRWITREKTGLWNISKKTNPNIQEPLSSTAFCRIDRNI